MPRTTTAPMAIKIGTPDGAPPAAQSHGSGAETRDPWLALPSFVSFVNHASS